MSKKSNSSRLQSANKLIQDESSIVSETPYDEKLQSSGSVVSKEVEYVNTNSNAEQVAPTPEPLNQGMAIEKAVEEKKVSGDASPSDVEEPTVSGDATSSDVNQSSLLNETISNGEEYPKNYDDSDDSDDSCDSDECSIQPPCEQNDEDNCAVAVLTNVSVVMDESSSLQNASTSIVAGDSDDNDISVAQLPAEFSSRLSELDAGVPIESALSGYDGTAGKNVFNLPSASLVAAMTLTNASGDVFSGEDSGLKTLADESIFLFSDESDSDIVLGKTSSGDIIFAVYLEQTNIPVQGGALWTVLYEPLKHNDPTYHDDKLSLDGLVYVKLETLGANLLNTAAPGQHLFFMVGDSDSGYVVTGRDPANQSEGFNPNTGDRVNVSNAGGSGSIGINNQMIDPPAKPGSSENNSGEGVVFTFVKDPDSAFTGENLSQTEADVEANIKFGGLINVDSATFTISQTQPVKAATVKVSAYTTTLETDVNFIDGLLDDDISVAVTGVTVLDPLGNILAKSDGSVVNPLIQISFDDGSAIIRGVRADYQIEYETDGTHNRVLIENPGSSDKNFNSAFDIGSFSYEQPCTEILHVGEFIVFEDSGPSTGFNPVAYMDDDSLSGGNAGGISDAAPDTQNTSGILSHQFGADGEGSISWLFYGAPTGFDYVAQGDDLLIKQGETIVLTLTLNPASGEYAVIQNAPVQHASGMNENDQVFVVSYQVIDGDGDQAEGSLLLMVDDDTPVVMQSAIVQLDDDALPNGNPDGVGDASPDIAHVTGSLAFSYGADGPGSISWLTTGAPVGFSYELSGDDLLVKQDGTTVITVTYDPDTNEYSVAQNAPVLHAAGMDENDQNFNISFAVTDSDDDTVIGSLVIRVDDDTPSVTCLPIVKLDDDALVGGNPGGVGDDSPDVVNATGMLVSSFGADGPGSIQWISTGAPAGFSYEVSGSDLFIQQGDVTVVTISMNPLTGEYSVVQNAAVKHPPGMNENDLALHISYSVTDADHDEVIGSMLICIDDDTPVVSCSPVVYLDDGALPGGNPGGIGDIDPDSSMASGVVAVSFGADDPGALTWIASGAPAGFTYEVSGDALFIKQASTTVITALLDAETGAYSVVQNAPVMHLPGMDENDQTFLLSYNATDGDGDAVVGSLFVIVDDDTPVVTQNAVVQLDDNALTDGNLGGVGDVSPDTSNTSGVLGHSFGADGAGSFAWLTTGAPEGFTYEASGSDLLVKQGAVTVMTLTLNTETGAYAVIQNAPIMHAEGMDENDQSFSFAYLVTDADGDTAQGELMVSVDDDTPVVTENAVVQLDDDALLSGNAGGVGDVSPDTANTSGTLGHSFGADGAGSFAWLTTGSPEGFTYEASGDDLLVKQGVVTVMTLTLNTETGAYSVTQNAPVMHAAGMDENDQSFSFAYLVTDADGDTAQGELMVSVDDDTPVVTENAVVQLDDDALAGGNPGGIGDVNPDTANTSGILGHSFGADGAGSFVWLTTGAPEGFTYEASGSDLLVKQGAVTVMTLALNTETGAYAVTQNAPIMHAEGMDENDQSFSFAYLVTDADGDTAQGELMVSVDDDTPVVTQNAVVQLDDDALAGGNPGGVGDVSPDTANTSGTLGHSFGADGAGSFAWLSTGAPEGFTYEVSGDDLLVKQGAVTVMTLNLDIETGAYAVTQNAPIMHAEGMDENDQNFSFAYLVTDADGDSAQGELMVSVDDDTPVVTQNAVVQLDDDALAGGNPGGIGDVSPDTANTTGTLGYSFGADGAGSFAWLTTGAPAGFTYEASGSDLLVKQGAVTVMTLALNTETGAYVVTQNAPIMHAAGMDENDQNFSFAYLVTDADGDSAQGELMVSVDDDTPVVTENAVVQLDDDALLGGNAGGVGDVSPDTANTSGTLGHSFGADGAGSFAWLTTGAPAGFTYEASGDDLLVKQSAVTVMTLTLNTETGAYAVTQNAPIMHAAGMDENDQNFSFAYLVTDADGDSAQGELMVSVDDDTPVVTENAVIQLDDDALAGGNAGGIGDVNPDTANTSGILGHNFGADGAGSFAWLTTGAPEGFTYEASGSDLLVKQGAVTVMTLALNTETGAYVVTQNAPIMHAAGMDENDQSFSFAYLVTDADGDTAQGELMVSVDDDTPVVTENAVVQLDDDALAGGNPGGIGDVSPDTANTTGTLGYSFGADGAGSFAWLTTGAPEGFTYEASGSDLLVKQGAVTVMTLNLNTETGAYVVTQNAPIMHAEGMDENDQSFSFAYLVTDADGDSTQGELMVSVDDDTPVVTENAVVQLDDDALAGGNAGGVGDVSPDTSNTSGILGHSFGADGAGSFAWLSTGAPEGFMYEASSDDLLVKQGAVTVMTLNLDTETGAYVVTQNAPIMHTEGMDENDQSFSFAYLVTDADGDSAQGELIVSVDDDTPVVTENAVVQLDDDALVGGNAGGIGDINPDTANTTGTLGYSFGADGAGSFAWLTTGAPAGFTYEASGDDLLVKQGAVTVMTLALNTETGAYAVTQNAPIMHSAAMDENDQSFSFAYLVTDADGDSAQGELMVSVDDDTPVATQNAVVHLDDDALAGGNPGGVGDVSPDTSNTSGILGHSFGADGAGSFAWLTTGVPEGFTYEASGDDLLVKQGAVTVITLTLNTETGAYAVTQNAPIMHSAAMDENDQNFSFAYLVTDADGDTTQGELMVSVDDDTPVVTENAVVQLDDDALAGGNPGGVGDVSPDTSNTSGVLGHNFGADGAGSFAWLTTGAPEGFTYEASGDDLLVKQGAVTVMTLNLNTETGAYTVTQNAPIMHAAGMDENDQSFSFAYLVTDADGDSAQGELMVSVDDDTPVVTENAVVQLDDDALAGGNPGGIGDVNPDSANTTGTLGYSFGADGAGSFAWLTTGAPAGFTYEASGDDLLVKQGAVTVMTLTLNTETGAYAVTQNTPIMHAAGMDENDQSFSFAYLVTDADGDSAQGELMVSVDDDTPVVTENAVVQLDDDALAGGNPGGVGDVNPDTANTSGTLGYSFGADGAGSFAWLTTGAPAGFTYEASGDDLLVKQGAVTVMTLTLNTETGAYAVTQNAPIMHAAGMDENDQSFSFAYLVTDADGDSAQGELMVSVDDDTPVALRNSVVQLDDDALAGGIPGGLGDASPDLVNTTGVLGHQYGADGAGSISWVTNGAPAGFTYEVSDDNLLIKQGAVTVMTLSVDSLTGAYSVVQNAALTHPSALDENNQVLIVSYRVADADGDSTTGQLVIVVNDDSPVVMQNAAVQLDDDALLGGNPGGVGDVDPDTANTVGVLQHSFGADGTGNISWLTVGAPTGYTYESSGDDLLIKQEGITVVTMTLNTETGAYVVTQNAPVMHAGGLDSNNQEFIVAYKVTDADGDSAVGELVIDVNDDTPVVTRNEVVLLDDDILTGGNPGGTGDVNPDTEFANGVVNFSFGADGAGSLTWLASGAPEGFAYQVNGETLSVVQGSTTVMTLTLDSMTGAYSVVQNAPIQHESALDENNFALIVGYTVVDADDDSAIGELVIVVNDDTPVVLDVADLIFSNSDNPTPGGTSTFSYSIGADSRSNFSALSSDFHMYSLTGQIGLNSITNTSITWVSESATEAEFSLAFEYQPSAVSEETQQATGTIRFDKVNGTYTVALSEPVQSYSILTTSEALSYTGYEINSQTLDGTQPAVAVAALSNSVYAQFVGIAEPGGGTGGNNLQAVGVDGDGNTFTNGELITQASTWVTTSNTANGVAGDTIQKGEVLDFDLFNTNPYGFTDAEPSAFASELFLKFDGVGSEDLVVILKLIDPDTLSETTRAIIVDNSDILKIGNSITPTYGITLDNNDGAVIFQSNDFNAEGENYLISGAQILVSTEGLVGSGINFNSAIGELGASVGTQSFGASTTDNDVLKISDIGLVTSETSTLDLALEITLAVKDADADISDTQTLGIVVSAAPEMMMDLAAHSGSMGVVEHLS